MEENDKRFKPKAGYQLISEDDESKPEMLDIPKTEEEVKPTTKRKRQRKLTSEVWDDFEFIKPQKNGELRCKCKRCGKDFNAESKSGTGNLKRHLDRCKKRCYRDSSLYLEHLARMARDILAIPISTVASELALSTGGRVLDPYRSSLKPSIVEAIICLKDWVFGEAKMQPQLEELCGAIMNMNVQEDVDTPPESESPAAMSPGTQDSNKRAR
ncbi:putative AC transposase [Bienertia sinuspersici]